MSATQLLNAEEIALLKTVFPARTEPNVAFGNLSMYLELPSLRGYWPMSSVDENGAVYDLSGQGRTLTNNSAAQFGVYNGLAPYVIGDRTADYLSRPDEAGLSITGAMTVYVWVWHDGAISGTQSIAGKYLSTGNQRTWLIHSESLTTIWQATISPDGTAGASVIVASTVPLTPNIWTFLAMVYVPSTSLTLYVSENGRAVPTVETTSIPAALFDSTAAFTIAAQGAGAAFFGGRVAQVALCAAAHDNLTIQTIFYHTRALFGQ